MFLMRRVLLQRVLVLVVMLVGVVVVLAPRPPVAWTVRVADLRSLGWLVRVTLDVVRLLPRTRDFQHLHGRPVDGNILLTEILCR